MPHLELWHYGWLPALPGEEGEIALDVSPNPRLTSWLAFAVDHGLARPTA
ncbi:MAG: hypothetical protein ABI240_18185 [Sphingomonas sp.]